MCTWVQVPEPARGVGSPGVGIIGSVSHLKWMLGIELWSSDAAVCALSHGAISPGPEKQTFLTSVLIAGYSGSSLSSWRKEDCHEIKTSLGIRMTHGPKLKKIAIVQIGGSLPK